MKLPQQLSLCKVVLDMTVTTEALTQIFLAFVQV